MPIVVLEGPDRSGKTTLFRALTSMLRGARFVSVPTFRISSADDLTRHNLAMWEAVYDRSQLYVCDRSSFVSSQVYMRLRGESPPDVSRWYRDVLVVYLDVVAEELRRRHRATNDFVGHEDIDRVLELYEQELPNWRYMRTDGSNVEGVVEWIGMSC